MPPIDDRSFPFLFEQTLARMTEWTAGPDVLGVLLVGSKSHGHGDAMSDDDLEIILDDAAHSRRSPEACHELAFLEGHEGRLAYDAFSTSLSDLLSKPASARDLDHWPYEHAKILFDRDGHVAPAVQAAAAMPAEFRRLRILHGALDVHLALGRIEKTARRGYEASLRTLVARGARALSRVLFARESRWLPMDHWLEAELATLEDPSGAAPLLVEGLATGRHEPLRAAIERLQPWLETQGFPEPAGRGAFFLQLVHPARASERATHGLP